MVHFVCLYFLPQPHAVYMAYSSSRTRRAAPAVSGDFDRPARPPFRSRSIPMRSISDFACSVQSTMLSCCFVLLSCCTCASLYLVSGAQRQYSKVK